MHSRTPLSLSCCVTYPHPRERVEHKRRARCAEMCSPNENVAMVVLLLLRCCVLRAERDRRTVVFLIAALASLPPLLSSSTITSQPLSPLSCTDIKEPSMAARFCTPRQPQLAWFPLLPQSFLQPSMSVSHLCLSSPLALLTCYPSCSRLVPTFLSIPFTRRSFWPSPPPAHSQCSLSRPPSLRSLRPRSHSPSVVRSPRVRSCGLIRRLA
jgi:hypothetical protein